jgi:hypothetical protein
LSGLLDFKSTVEKRTQCYFHDDGTFEFRKLPFEDSCMVEKAEGIIKKAWKHTYSGETRFDGFKSIHADMVTLGFGRDIFLDPFNKIKVSGSPNGGKPNTDELSIRSWTSQVAETQRYKVMNHPGSMLLVEKITMFLGCGFILELIIFGITKIPK